jgi:hypothetical protein
MMVARELEPTGVEGAEGREPRIAGHADLAMGDDEPGVAQKLELHALSLSRMYFSIVVPG